MEDDNVPEADKLPEEETTLSPNAGRPKEEVISSTEARDLPAEPTEVATEDAQHESVEPLEETPVSAAVVEETIEMEAAIPEPSETVEESLPEPPDGVQEHPRGSIPHALDNPEETRNLTPEPPSDPAEGVHSEAASDQESVKGSIPEPHREATPDPPKEATPELAKEATPEAVEEMAPEPEKDPFQESPRDSMADLMPPEESPKVTNPTPSTKSPQEANSPQTAPLNSKPVAPVQQPAIVVPKQKKQRSCCLLM